MGTCALSPLPPPPRSLDECAGIATCAGARGGPSKLKVNQDTGVIVWPLGDSDVLTAGMFDGHGASGEIVSRYAALSLARKLDEHAAALAFDQPGSVPELLKRCFADTDEALESLDHYHGSGSTATVALVVSTVLWVACVGDSRCIRVTERSGGDGWAAIPISVDHKPELAEETVRIESSGGLVVTNSDGVGRVLSPKDSRGLMVSRAMGDGHLKKYGVSAEPDVFQHTLRRDDAAVIIASDGVWDLMSDERVVAIAYQHRHSAARAAGAIVAEAKAQWDADQSQTMDRMLKFYRDDITAIVLVLPSPAARPPARLQLVGSAAGPGAGEVGAQSDHGAAVAADCEKLAVLQASVVDALGLRVGECDLVGV